MQQQQLLTPRRKWRMMLFSPCLLRRCAPHRRQQQEEEEEGNTTQEDASSPESPLPPATTAAAATKCARKEEENASPPPPPSLSSTEEEELARYWPRPPAAMLAWREHAAARSSSSSSSSRVQLATLMRAMHQRKCSLSNHRATAVSLFILLMVSCPDMADAQVVALATQYLDRYIVATVGEQQQQQQHNYFHVAAACMALALKWERQDAGHDLASAPSSFNRLVEVFQRPSGGGGQAPPPLLTLAVMGRIERDVCVALHFDMWTCTPAEWLCLVRDAGPVAAVTDGDATTYPPLCWLRREPCGGGNDPLPRLEETSTGLARLPLEEQLLLHALRQPELVGWSPVRLGAACLVAAGRCSPARCEAARLCTSSNANRSDDAASLLLLVQAHRSTSKDAAALVGLLTKKTTPAKSYEDVQARIPSPPPPLSIAAPQHQ